MAGTSAGAKKAAETNKLKDPAYYQKLGKQVVNRGAGFALLSPEQRAELGRQGGKSNKGKKRVTKKNPTTPRDTTTPEYYVGEEGVKELRKIFDQEEETKFKTTGVRQGRLARQLKEANPSPSE
jgi:hypothetical protein